MSRKNEYRLIFTLALLFLSAAAVADTTKLMVVTTVAPITNIVQNVGGRYVEVTGIVPEGSDSHTFEPAPSDAKLLIGADIIIVNGLSLELPTVKLAEKVKRPQIKIVSLGERTISPNDWKFDFSFPKEKGHPNPHLWPNIALAMRYAEIARDELSNLDPQHTAGYEANTTAYLAKLEKLDEAIFACIKSIPEKNRKLVTYHDSFAYFAPRYGVKVIGAVQPADFSEPSPRDVMRIIDQLKKEQVPAIFGSEVFPSKTLAQIARETGARFIDQLADDELPGKLGDANHSFIGMMANNMNIMTEALGGSRNCAVGVDSANLPQ
ncbi:MAG: zinc ABC transporter substrate-binding protein [Gammaproteobacteria bacterium]|nr:zinc ABC transporter substrate-binding protein [Gammaproteobacteria bacterium]